MDKLEEIEMAKWDFYSWPPVSAGEISCRADITLIAGTRERRSRQKRYLSSFSLSGPLMATIAGLPSASEIHPYLNFADIVCVWPFDSELAAAMAFNFGRKWQKVHQ